MQWVVSSRVVAVLHLVLCDEAYAITLRLNSVVAGQVYIGGISYRHDVEHLKLVQTIGLSAHFHLAYHAWHVGAPVYLIVLVVRLHALDLGCRHGLVYNHSLELF